MPRIPAGARLTDLVVARESDTTDLPLLEGMILQTLERNPHLPGVEQLIEWGVKPVSDPATYGAEVLPRPGERKNGCRAVLFSFDGTGCLYSQGSAAKEDRRTGENGFVEILCDVINTHRPENIYVATFSRLVRSFDQASPVQRAISQARSRLHYGEGAPLSFDDDEAPIRWAMMAAFAAMERNAVVNRLTLGRVGKHRQGKWVGAAWGVPMGYTLREGRLVVAENARASVHKAIRLLGDPGIGMQELAISLGAIGVLPPSRSAKGAWRYDPDWEWDGLPYVPRGRRAREDADHLYPGVRAPERQGFPRAIREYGHPDAVGKRIAAALDLWETGRMVLEVANPLPKVSRFAEYPVVDNDAGEQVIQFPYEPGVPENGWATPEELARARAGLSQRAVSGRQHSHTKQQQLPLLGDLVRWNDGGHRYGLLSARSTRHERYELRRLVLPDEPSFDARTGVEVCPPFFTQNKRLGERMAIVDAAELHANLADALIEALTTGVPVEPHHIWPPSSMSPVSDTHLAELRSQRARLVKRATRARELLIDDDTASPALHAQLVADAERLLEEADRLGQELAEVEAEAGVSFAERLLAQPAKIAAALAGLSKTSGALPRDVSRSLSSVLTELRLRPRGELIDCSVKAHVPAEDGVVVVGPVHFTVAQRYGPSATPGRGRTPATTDNIEGRDRALARALLTTDASIHDVGNSRAINGETERKRARAFMTSLGMSRAWASLALLCVPRATRAVIWHLLSGDPAPEGLDSRFVERIRHTYFDQTDARRYWWRDTGLRFELLALLRDNGGAVTVEDARNWLMRRTTDPGAYAAMLSAPGDNSLRKSENPMLPILPAPRDNDRAPCRPGCPTLCWEHRILRLRPCPHPGCDGYLDRHLPVQELATGMMCGTCRREHDPDSPVFPAEYLDLNPQTAGDRQALIHPYRARTRHAQQAKRTLRDAARRWSIEQGLHDGSSALINEEQFDAYLGAIADGTVIDYSEIRDWARENGHEIKSRGRIPDEVMTAYRRDLARRVPKVARDWAAANGFKRPRRVDLNEDILEAFATHRPNN
jgi:DNA invertase Pin-like site-specific DNA recombinase